MTGAAGLVVWTSLWGRTLPDMDGEKEMRDRFAYALLRAVRARVISQRELAKRMGIDPRRVAAFLAAKALPNLYEARDMAAVLGVSEALFREPPAVPPTPPEPYYPIERYLLDSAAAQGAEEGRRMATRGPGPSAPGTPRSTREPRARGA